MPQPFLELNAEQTAKALRRYGEQLAAGRLSLSAFSGKAAEEIRSGVVAAFRFSNGGPLSTRQTALLNNLLAEQRHYFDRMVAGFRDGSIPLANAPYRAAAYGGATVQAGAMGAVSGKPRAARFTWQGPDGSASCRDCGPRIGRTLTGRTWLQRGLPGAVSCLSNCRCRLEAA